jgi:hypothetical protein
MEGMEKELRRKARIKSVLEKNYEFEKAKLQHQYNYNFRDFTKEVFYEGKALQDVKQWRNYEGFNRHNSLARSQNTQTNDIGMSIMTIVGDSLMQSIDKFKNQYFTRKKSVLIKKNNQQLKQHKRSLTVGQDYCKSIF